MATSIDDADGALYEPHHQPWQAQCESCRDGIAHRWHWFRGCTCAAGGCHTEHSGHCNLDGRPYGEVPATLVYDDTLLMPGEREALTAGDRQGFAG